MNNWLVKTEPAAYSWAQLLKDKKTAWTGVRNYAARNYLRAMNEGDQVFVYHSGEERQVVGVARITKAAYPDPTAEAGDWACVDIEAAETLARPVSLQTIKADKALREMVFVKQSRLSVSPVSPQQARRLLELASDS